MYFRKTLLTGMIVLATGAGSIQNNIAFAADQTNLPDRCAYVISTATARVATVVTGLLNNLNAYEQVRLANDATQLALSLNCSEELLVKSVDCAVEIVRSEQGHPLYINEAIDCFEEVSGSKFPSIQKN